jgi:lipopolysaccharide transport system ATP-binding protein
MSRPIIEVEGLSKRYRLGQFNARSLREEAERFMQRMRGQAAPVDEAEFWALRGVSFQVQPGEVVGIIGRNGAGKSTLLKILSRVTEPTQGQVGIRGRVASLLEVGTGFHPELSGRENIYLNGAILGMSRAEITAKFDEIVAFAEVEQFLDTPVKRYSSGMYVRLAFAVAAHLDPEILIVDEVLAVGDAEFQQKCLGKIEQVSGEEGRTVLFVSHNLSAVRRLCKRAIVLQNGVKILDDQAHTAVLAYLRSGRDERLNGGAAKPALTPHDGGHDEAALTGIYLLSADGQEQAQFNLNDAIAVRLRLRLTEDVHNFHLYLRLFREDGTLIFATADWDHGEVEDGLYGTGEYTITVQIPAHLLNAARYFIDVDGLVPSVRYVFRAEHAIEFDVLPFGGAGGVESIERRGVVRPLLDWQIQCLDDLRPGVRVAQKARKQAG